MASADPDAKGDYFDYSIDELGLQDLRAADDIINRLALQELGYAPCCNLSYHMMLPLYGFLHHVAICHIT